MKDWTSSWPNYELGRENRQITRYLSESDVYGVVLQGSFPA